MKMTKGVAALAGVLVLVCALVAWEWYTHVARGTGAVQPVQQVAAAPTPVPTASATPAAVVYVPQPASEPPAALTAPKRVTATASAPTASSPATVQPSASPQPTPSPTPYGAAGSGTLTNEPMVLATLAPHAISAEPVREAPDAPPRILAMSLSTPVAHGGDVVSGTVETTSNVASVEARIAGYSSSMQKIGVGRFALSYRVPNLPFFLHRTYTIEVIARNTRGDAVTSSLPITIR